MSKLKKEELLAWLNIWVRRWSMMSGEEKQAYQQIKEMIQKPKIWIRPQFSKRTEVTEEWIEEKANRIADMISDYMLMDKRVEGLLN